MNMAGMTATNTDAPSSGVFQRDAKKPRTATGIPSEVSISGQSDLEASMASSYDRFRHEDSDVQVEEDEKNDATAAPADNDRDQNNQDNDNDDDDDDEPKWDELLEYENTKNDINTFLSCREKRIQADNRFASAIDQLHDSVSTSMDDLVNAVVELFQNKSTFLDEYERSLNYDYVMNEKKRGEMQSKLEESARAAQGLFANLLMRIAQPRDDGGSVNGSGESVLRERGGAADNGTGAEGKENGDMGDEEPDWDAITQHEPAKTEVPIYLEARNRREVASARFHTAIQDFQQSAEECLQDLTQAMVDMYNDRSAKLDEYECMLKQEFVHNDEIRSKMKTDIEESANAANQMFDKLMDRVLHRESTSTSEHEVQMGVGTLTQATTLNSP